MRSYDYATRTGVEPISWERFAALAARLAEELAAQGVEIVLGVARAGLFPATAVALALRCELYPIRLTRRVDDRVRFTEPVWRVDVPPIVAGRAVAIVDEIADTGETLRLAAGRARSLGASRVRTASLVRHPWADPPPDHCPLVTPALVLFPWDVLTYEEGCWRPHPELTAARQAMIESKRGDP